MVPIGALGGVLSVLAMLTWRAATYVAQAETTEKRVDKLESVVTTIQEMKTDLAVVKERVQSMDRKLSRGR